MRNVDTIFIHCSAGFGDWRAVEKWWKEGLGWKSPGYHRFISTSGDVHKFADYEKVTNGVGGHNAKSIHICYQGGVDPRDVSKALDTRTPAQKWQLEVEIQEALSFLIKHQSIDDVRIIGHRDISPDKNLNGIIDPWERIKECPSFEVGGQYDPIKELVKKRYDLENSQK